MHLSYLVTALFLCVSVSFSRICVGQSLDATAIISENESYLDIKSFWNELKYEVLESSLEAGKSVDQAMISQTFRSDQNAKTSIVSFAASNWSLAPSLYELAVRYSHKMEGSDICSSSLAHQLASSSNIDHREKVASLPSVFYGDIYILALNGAKVNTRNCKGDSPFEILSRRLIESDIMASQVDIRLYLTLLQFHALSTTNDAFLKSDASFPLMTMQKRIPNGLYINALGNLRFVDPPANIPKLDTTPNGLGENFHFNKWYLKVNYANYVTMSIASHFKRGGKEADLEDFADSFPDVLGWIDDKGEAGVTLAMQAYSCGDTECLRTLLRLGASVDEPLTDNVYEFLHPDSYFTTSPSFCPRKGDTILLSAALDPFRKSDFIPLVLEHTQNPDARDLLNRNAIHRFLYHRVKDEQLFLLKLLIDARIDLNGRSVSGNTPCHVAANRNARLIPEMVDAGADLYAKNDRGETPVDLLNRSLDEKWIFHEENQAVLDQLKSQGRIKE